MNTPTKTKGLGAGMAADLTYWESAARGIASVSKGFVPLTLRLNLNYIHYSADCGQPGTTYTRRAVTHD